MTERIIKIGRHVVRNGDLMGDMSFIPLSSFDFVYSDPPWGEGNMKFWRTMNKKMNGSGAAFVQEVSFDAFLGRFFEVVDAALSSSGVLFMEYGVRWRENVLAVSEKYKFVCNAVLRSVYSAQSHPLDIFVFSRSPVDLPDGYHECALKTKGYKTLKAVTAPFNLKGGRFLDPCCGLGYTARLAVENEGIFYGNELNYARLRKTIEKLEKGK